jgi:hypothetical protein
LAGDEKLGFYMKEEARGFWGRTGVVETEPSQSTPSFLLTAAWNDACGL